MVVDVVRGKQRGGDKGGLPSAESVRRPQTQAEAIKMIELSQKLLELGLQFVGQQLSQEVRKSFNDGVHKISFDYLTFLVSVGG